MKSLYILALFTLIIPFSSIASEWEIDKEYSHIKFFGDHAGNQFSGEFKEWSGKIIFDPENLEESQAVIEVNLSSANTGDETYDKTLPQSDWFNLKDFTTAKYKTTLFKRGEGEGKYIVQGVLDIRGFEIPVPLDAEILISGDLSDKAIMTASTTLNRLDFEIGKKSDGAGDWVSIHIPLEIKVEAHKKSHFAEIVN